MTGFNRVVAPSLDPEQSREDFLVMIQSLKKEVSIMFYKFIAIVFYSYKIHNIISNKALSTKNIHMDFIT